MMTDRQTEVYNFIVGYISKHGFSPSFAEIAEGTGLASSSSASRYVRRIEKEGLIKTVPGRSRGIELVSNDIFMAVVKVKKRHKGFPSVIEISGKRYVYDPA